MFVIGTLHLFQGTPQSMVHRQAVRVIVQRNNTFLFVQSRRYGDVKFPGGGVEENETLVATACRECREETGYEVIPTTVHEVGEFHESRHGQTPGVCLSMVSYYFRADIDELVHPSQLMDYEVEYEYEVVWMTLADAIRANEIAYAHYPTHVPWCAREMEVMRALLST